jgi:hypothetical protein
MTVALNRIVEACNSDRSSVSCGCLVTSSEVASRISTEEVAAMQYRTWGESS